MSQRYPFQGLTPTVRSSPVRSSGKDNSRDPLWDQFLGTDEFLPLFEGPVDDFDPLDSFQDQHSYAGYVPTQVQSSVPGHAGDAPRGNHYIGQQGSQIQPSASNQVGNIPDGCILAENFQFQGNQVAYQAPAQQQHPSQDQHVDFQYVGVNARSQTQQYHKTKKRTAAAVEASKPQSKRAERRAKIVEEYGSVSASDVPKGVTRERYGIKEWWDPIMEQWCLAAPLDDFRRQIINEDSTRGAYVVPPEHGVHVDDVTTFPRNDFINQKHWNFNDRASWGNIQDLAGNAVMYLLDRPEYEFEYPSPGFMMYGNIIMLDPDDHPIIDWPGIPRCFSSQVEGGRIEALRRIYPWVSLPQFRARMPRIVQKKNVGPKKLFGHSGLTQRLARFREVYDCPPWVKSHVFRGADQVRHNKARLAQEGLGPNSTARLTSVSNVEVQRRKRPQKEKSPENAGLYILTEEEQKEKDEKEAARERKRYEEDGESSEKFPANSLVGVKRTRDDTESLDRIDQASMKRQCLSSESASRYTSQSVSPQQSRPASSLRSRSEIVDISDESVDYSQIQPQSPDMVSRGTGNQTSNMEEPIVEPIHPFDIDIRDQVPQTFAEQVCIKAALSYTIAHYRYFHVRDPPPTTNSETYLSQYEKIQTHHHNEWLVPGGVPQLVGLTMWFGSFNAIPVPDISEEDMQRLLPRGWSDDLYGIGKSNPGI